MVWATCLAQSGAATEKSDEGQEDNAADERDPVAPEPSAGELAGAQALEPELLLLRDQLIGDSNRHLGAGLRCDGLVPCWQLLGP